MKVFRTMMVLAFCVINVAANNLDLGKTAYTLIYFYSSTCIYCQAFDSDFENLVLLFNESVNLQIIKVKPNNQLSKSFNVNQYPTISLYELATQKIVKYRGNRDLPSLIDFLQEHTKESPNYNFAGKLTILNNENYHNYLEKRLVVFTADYLPEWNNYQLPTHFIHEIKDVNMGIVDLQDNVGEILANYQLSQFPVMVYFENDKNFKKGVVDVLDREKVIKFIDSISNPLDWIYDYTYTPVDYEDDSDYDYSSHDEL